MPVVLLQWKIQEKVIPENLAEEYVVDLIPEVTTIINSVKNFVTQATELLSISYAEKSAFNKMYLFIKLEIFFMVCMVRVKHFI